jgi:ubiquinone/menaquinone biosynthesis C-methylase UbiE
MTTIFDSRAKEWDSNNIHHVRSVAVAERISKLIPLNPSMTALEYGAGTGILSFLMSDKFSKITLLDSSVGMIDVCKEKITSSGISNMDAQVIDLEVDQYDSKIDIVYSQMTFHHIANVYHVVESMYGVLNVNGWLSIVDLYQEDGTFHEHGEKVHHGFDPDNLVQILSDVGFLNIKYETCFEMKKSNGRIYPIFILVAQK